MVSFVIPKVYLNQIDINQSLMIFLKISVNEKHLDVYKYPIHITDR